MPPVLRQKTINGVGVSVKKEALDVLLFFVIGIWQQAYVMKVSYDAVNLCRLVQVVHANQSSAKLMLSE